MNKPTTYISLNSQRPYRTECNAINTHTHIYEYSFIDTYFDNMFGFFLNLGT